MASDSAVTKKILEPENTRELLRGWLIHSHKGRQRHDRAARRLDRHRLWLGVVAAVVSAAVGTSVFSALKEETSPELKLAIGALSILAAILTGLSTFLNLPERSDKHRTAAVSYKSMIRQLEVRLTGELDSSVVTPVVIDEIRKSLDELEKNSPIVPEGIYTKIDDEWNKRPLEIIDKAEDFYKEKV